MIYLISFIVFLIFFACMALGYILAGKKLKSEGEANAILEGLTCASCTAHCAFAGQSDHAPADNCKSQRAIPHKVVEA